MAPPRAADRRDALAEETHRSAPRGQKPARARGEEEDEENYAKGQVTPPPRAAAAEIFPMTPDAGGGLAAGARPALLGESGPQSGVGRHAGVGYEVLLDVRVPQMERGRRSSQRSPTSWWRTDDG